MVSCSCMLVAQAVPHSNPSRANMQQKKQTHRLGGGRLHTPVPHDGLLTPGTFGGSLQEGLVGLGLVNDGCWLLVWSTMRTLTVCASASSARILALSIAKPRTSSSNPAIGGHSRLVHPSNPMVRRTPTMQRSYLIYVKAMLVLFGKKSSYFTFSLATLHCLSYLLLIPHPFTCHADQENSR